MIAASDCCYWPTGLGPAQAQATAWQIQRRWSAAFLNTIHMFYFRDRLRKTGMVGPITGMPGDNYYN